MHIPRDPRPDATLAFWRGGYRFVSETCERLGSDAFRTRLMLRPVVCMRGREAAAILYDGDRVTREGAMPSWVLRLLQGKGSVEVLAGPPHHHRKQLYLDWLGPGRFDALVDRIAEEYRLALPRWQDAGRIELLAELRRLIVRASGRWAGIAVDGLGRGAISSDRLVGWFDAMIENVERLGPSHLRARQLRRAADRWAIALIEEVREQAGDGPPTMLLEAFALHRDADGTLLPSRVAAYELFNVLRPAFAIARFVVFAVDALIDHPEWLDRLRRRPDEIRAFVQEVRRMAPFFPVIGGIAREPVIWRGVALPAGTWMLLDLYGTNRHPALWPEPDRFDPKRFLGAGATPDALALVPQGGGDHATGHRCPGEWVTIDTMGRLLALLLNETRFTVPPQDRSVALDRIPARPASGIVLGDVRAGSAPPAGEAEAAQAAAADWQARHIP